MCWVGRGRCSAVVGLYVIELIRCAESAGVGALFCMSRVTNTSYHCVSVLYFISQFFICTLHIKLVTKWRLLCPPHSALGRECITKVCKTDNRLLKHKENGCVLSLCLKDYWQHLINKETEHVCYHWRVISSINAFNLTNVIIASVSATDEYTRHSVHITLPYTGNTADD